MEKCKTCNGIGKEGIETGMKSPAPYFIIAFECKDCNGTGESYE